MKETLQISYYNKLTSRIGNLWIGIGINRLKEFLFSFPFPVFRTGPWWNPGPWVWERGKRYNYDGLDRHILLKYLKFYQLPCYYKAVFKRAWVQGSGAQESFVDVRMHEKFIYRICVIIIRVLLAVNFPMSPSVCPSICRQVGLSVEPFS